MRRTDAARPMACAAASRARARYTSATPSTGSWSMLHVFIDGNTGHKPRPRLAQPSP